MDRLVICIFALIAFTGCPGGGTLLDTLDFPQTEPQPKDLAGTYRPDAATVKDIRVRGHYPERDISIRLSADGRFACTNIPDWWTAEFGKPSGDFITATGTWRVAREQSFWQIELEWTSAGRRHGASINLVGKKAPFFLRIYLGDPDEGKVMQFAKDEASPSA
ncbi:MAG TPA: hypothetical protein VGW57_17845 [Chthoniobacterales bacterium]|nr:hypothetical protein [Chthoniobacterales bacterium]